MGVFITNWTSKSVQVTRELPFWAKMRVFGHQSVPKTGRRLLVISHFQRKLVSARVRRLLGICIFWTRLIAYTHREVVFLAETSSQVFRAPRNIYHAIAIKYIIIIVFLDFIIIIAF